MSIPFGFSRNWIEKNFKKVGLSKFSYELKFSCSYMDPILKETQNYKAKECSMVYEQYN